MGLFGQVGRVLTGGFLGGAMGAVAGATNAARRGLVAQAAGPAAVASGLFGRRRGRAQTPTTDGTTPAGGVMTRAAASMARRKPAVMTGTPGAY